MKKLNWKLLQLFSGEADSGETDVDAGHQAAEAVPAQEAENVAPKMTWEEVKAQPEFQQKMQEMVRNRLKNAKQAEQTLTRLAPALGALSRFYGIEGDTPNIEALVEAVAGDARLARPQKVDTIASHFHGLQAQAKALGERIPNFDLEKELENPAFVRLTAPGVGVSLEDAYYTVHRRELEDTALAEKTRQISNAIRSGSLRPEENGTLSHTPSVTTFDYRSASRDQREALKKQIRMAAARGEKLYPGSI